MSTMKSPKPTWFTYKPFDRGDDLSQGDILQPTKSVRKIFEDVHPHFLDAKYTAFLVLTQTCDLVRRKKRKCAARYINLAVVRPLQEILLNLLDRECTKIEITGKTVEGGYIKESKSKANDLLERILNQNEQRMGIFYLHQDAAVKIREPSVALLQVSIAVKAQEHYDALVDALCGRLMDEFRDRLGWLVGNLYSRVATKDVPGEVKDDLIKRFLPRDYADDAPFWIPESNVHQAEKDKLNLEGLSQEKVATCLKECRPKPARETAIKQVLSTIEEILGPLSGNKAEDIAKRLRQDPQFNHACQKAL